MPNRDGTGPRKGSKGPRDGRGTRKQAMGWQRARKKVTEIHL